MSVRTNETHCGSLEKLKYTHIRHDRILVSRIHMDWRVCVCVCARAWGWDSKGGLITLVKKGKPTNKSVQRPFHMFSIEIWWIFCHRAFEVIAEHTVQRNPRLGHCLPSLCCHLHCALLTPRFSKEQHPTPPINASLGPVLAVSRGGEHVSRLFRHDSHTQTFTREEKLLRSPETWVLFNSPFLTPFHFVAGPECTFGSFYLSRLIPNLSMWLSNISILLSITSDCMKKLIWLLRDQ